LQSLLDSYHGLTHEDLWKNLEFFLSKIVPVAEKEGIKLAIHPDDPPWDIFGLPRIIINEAALKRVCEAVDSPANGICLCTGSLGANPENDIIGMATRLFAKIHFVHARNVKTTAEHTFHETYHDDPEGNVCLPDFMRVLAENNYNGPIRPDHGRMIWGEKGRAGYGLYDRALGALYLTGLWDAWRARLAQS
jgi:mannonate dehydratase